MKKIALYIIICQLYVFSACYAEIFKCISEDGVSIFSDQPCGNNSKVLFQDDSNLTIDAAIGNGSPFSKSVVYSNSMETDIKFHAKRIGQRIFPDNVLKSDDISESKSTLVYTWLVYLSYYSPTDRRVWNKIVMEYTGAHKDGKIIVQLKKINLDRYDRLFNRRLASLKDSKKIWKYLNDT